MAELKLKIRPLEVPSEVLVDVPGTNIPVTVQIGELDAETLALLIEEFSANLLALVEK